MAGKKTEAGRRILGRNVRRLRLQRGWNQEILASAAKLQQGQISSIEAGKSNTTVDVLQRLARALGVPVAELFADGGR